MSQNACDMRNIYNAFDSDVCNVCDICNVCALRTTFARRVISRLARIRTRHQVEKNTARSSAMLACCAFRNLRREQRPPG